MRRTFTALSQLASINNYSPNSNLISGFAYQYDDVGKRTSKTESFVGTVPTGNIGVMSNTSNYGYDDLDRLTASSSPRENFSYDVVGNRNFAAGTNYNAINQLLGDGWKYSFEYNLNGDMTKKTNLLTGQETNFVWNAESQLVTMQIAAAGSVTKEIFFKYDGLGRRIERQVVDHTDGSKSYGRKFFYDGQMIIEEQDLNGNLVARYMNGSGIDDPLLVARVEGNFVFTKDGLGSIRELTKTDGTSIQKYRYSAYGVTTQELQESRPDKKLIENRYAYTGREIEDETGLYYYRARYYDPELGRFISEDPIGFDGGDTNLYAYVGGNPLSYVDPTGLYWFRQSWQEPGAVGRPRTIVPPAPDGRVSNLIEQYVPAGYTFGQMHDSFVDWATGAGAPDWLVNIPSMVPLYLSAVVTEGLRTVGILNQPTPNLPISAQPTSKKEVLCPMR